MLRVVKFAHVGDGVIERLGKFLKIVAIFGTAIK